MRTEPECTVVYSGALVPNNDKNFRVLLKLPCLAPSCTKEDAMYWVCLGCESPITYSFGDHLYCRCGKGLAVNYKFKCWSTNPGHRHVQEQLRSMLRQIKRPVGKNILISSACGKIYFAE